MAAKYRLTKTIDKSVQPWMDPTEVYKKGTIVYHYYGVTYGCIGPNGVAVSLQPDTNPFFEVPRAALERVKE